MFTVKKGTTLERHCPNGHTPLPDLLPESNQSLTFCHICGTPIEERQVPYDAPCCANCNNLVDPCWEHCPYCGQGRDKLKGGQK